MRAVERNNVRLSGDDEGRPIVFAHGFGCDQAMWREVASAFEQDHRVVLFDHVGAGRSDTSAYDREAYSTLDRYASDVVEILDELDLHDVVFVGHSVSSMIGVLAVAQRPQRFGALVMVTPSPRYLDDEGYVGGFSEADVDGLLETMEGNFLDWSAQLAPVIMGTPDRPALGAVLTDSFCRTDPEIAADFARVTFLSDNRADLRQVTVPTLVVQCRDDALAPPEVGAYVLGALPDGALVELDATGHCPNISAPAQTRDAIRAFLDATTLAVR